MAKREDGEEELHVFHQVAEEEGKVGSQSAEYRCEDIGPSSHPLR